MVEYVVKGFGFPSEWKVFHERHHLFFERMPNLKAALETAFIRELAPSSVADTVVEGGDGVAFVNLSEIVRSTRRCAFRFVGNYWARR